MGGMTIRWQSDAFRAALKAWGEKADEVTGGAVDSVLRLIVRQERTLLNLGSHPRGTKTGSPPGSPPWRISGDLGDSVRADRAKRRGPGVWFGQAGPTAIYARIQELGGDTGRGHRTHLPPRPHLYPAVRLVRPAMRDEFYKAWWDAQRWR